MKFLSTMKTNEKFPVMGFRQLLVSSIDFSVLPFSVFVFFCMSVAVEFVVVFQKRMWVLEGNLGLVVSSVRPRGPSVTGVCVVGRACVFCT